MEASRDWLDQFEPAHRGAIANWFYEVVRRHGGRVDLSQGCSEVYREQARQLQRYGERPGEGVSKHLVLRAMQRDPDGARRLMAWVMAREARSPAERAQDRAAAEADGKRHSMESQAPTEKQRALLRRLGYTGDVENRWHASQLIEEHRDW